MSQSNSSVMREVIHVTPSYSYLSDKLRRFSAGSLQCSLFCGGHGCKYENGENWKDEDKVLRRLYSHWVTPNILAMTRPSTDLIENHDLVGELKRCGIKSVINLQLPWEHAKCGPGIEHSSGFTYRPEALMNNGIYYYNYGWIDYNIPTIDYILDMVKVMDFAIGEGKVGVHCHAGLGRTGVLIACYLSYSLRITGDEAVEKVRMKRPGSIQTRLQIEVVRDFSSFLSPLWRVFPCPSIPISFKEVLHNQRLVTHGTKETDIKYTPKVLHEVCQRLLELLSHDSAHQSCDASVFESLFNNRRHLNLEEEGRLEEIKEEMNTSIHWNLLESETSYFILTHMISLFLTSLKYPLLATVEEADDVIQGKSFNQSFISEAKRITLLKILDALGILISTVRDATPTLPAKEATVRPHPLLPRTLSTQLAESLFQSSNNSTDHVTQTLSEMIMKYWSKTCQ